MLNVYLSTCDKTSYILTICTYLWKKFTNNNVNIYILGFEKPILDNWNKITFIKLADKQENINKWSSYIYEYLKDIPDEYLIFAMDDELPIDYINNDNLDIAMQILKDNKHYGLCNLGNCYCPAHPANKIKIIYDNNNFNIWEKRHNHYKINGQPVIWNKEYLLKQLKQNVSPWNFELRCSNNAINDGYIALHPASSPCLNEDADIIKTEIKFRQYKPILNFANETALSGSRGVPSKINILGLKCEYINELINNNLVSSKDLIFGLCKICYTNYDDIKNCFDFNTILNKIKKCPQCNYKAVYIRYNQYYI